MQVRENRYHGRTVQYESGGKPILTRTKKKHLVITVKFANTVVFNWELFKVDATIKTLKNVKKIIQEWGNTTKKASV